MYINEDTKISVLIKHNLESINAIASISKHFEKLKNPVLRKILASRVTIKQAAKIGGTNPQTFFDKLIPLGFTIADSKDPVADIVLDTPSFYVNLDSMKVNELDVRITLKEGKDPFNDIMNAIDKLPNDFTLKIVNTFEPTPLINILTKKGFDYHTVDVDRLLVHTFFKRKGASIQIEPVLNTNLNENSETQDLLNKYGDHVKTIDVRHLEMPLPMKYILQELDTLEDDVLLYVHHKRIPKFLLPELANRGYNWSTNEIAPDDVKLLIFK